MYDILFGQYAAAQGSTVWPRAGRSSPGWCTLLWVSVIGFTLLQFHLFCIDGVLLELLMLLLFLLQNTCVAQNCLLSVSITSHCYHAIMHERSKWYHSQ